MSARFGSPTLFALGLTAGVNMTPAAAAGVPAPPESDLAAALFSDATFTAHLRSFLFDRVVSNGPDPGAWAVGGWLGYETGWIADVLRFGVVGYTSQPLWAPKDRNGTLLLHGDQEGYSVLGQAYAEFKYKDNLLTAYRHIVNQPEVNAQDNRMTPNTFEGVSLKGDFGTWGYYGGFLTAMKPRNAIDFVNIAGAAGIDQNEDMVLGTLSFSPMKDAKGRTSLYVVPNVLASSYSDAVWKTGIGAETALRTSAQFMYQSSIGEGLLMGEGFEAWVAGIKGDLIYKSVTLTAGYTYAGEDANWQSPYGTWPGFTNMQIKDFNRAEEQAVLLAASLDVAAIGLRGLVVTASTAFDTHIADGLAEWTEYDFDAEYRLSWLEGDWEWLAPLALRGRYGYLISEQNGTSNQTTDLRLILNYEVQFKGSDI